MRISDWSSDVCSSDLSVFAMDFLALNPDLIGSFDRIIMNPPFDRGRDIDHVNHAIEFLAPGGILVAIMSAGTEFKSDAKAAAFHAKIERYRARFRDLDPGSFASVGTMVNTVVLTPRTPMRSEEPQSQLQPLKP